MNFMNAQTTTSFLDTNDVRTHLNRLIIIRVDPHLCERINTALTTNPGLTGLSRSAFARKAMVYVLNSLEPDQANLLSGQKES
jgi:hypothetical protein